MNIKEILMFVIAAVLTLSVSAGRLPSGFVELKYIEANGDQPVLTKYTPKGSTSVKMRLALNGTWKSQAIFCARGMDNNVRTFTMFWVANQGLRWDYGQSAAVGTVYDKSISSGEPFDLEIKRNEVYLNSSESPSSISHEQPVDYLADNALVLFASYNAESNGLQETTTFSNCGNICLYSLTVTEGNEVVMDLVPCLNHNQDDAVGLYDMVSGCFLASCRTSLGMGESAEVAVLTVDSDREGALCRTESAAHEVPADVPIMVRADSAIDTSLMTFTPIGWELTVTPRSGASPYTVKNSGLNARCCDFTPQEGDELLLKWHCAKTEYAETIPVGYRRLDYVRTTGTQSLLTDYTPMGRTCVDMVMRINNLHQGQAIFCSRGANSDQNSFSLMAVNSGLRWDYGDEKASDGQVVGVTSDKICVSIRSNDIYINSKWANISKPVASDYTAGNKLVLFASYNTDRPQEPTGFANFATIDLSLFRVLEDGCLIRQYLPCERIMDNAIGFYETVTGKFLQPSGDPLVAGERIQTTRAFIASYAKYGQTELPSEYAPIDFVEATGSQYVVTDYTPTGNSAFSAKLDIVESTPMGIFCARGAGSYNPYTLFYTSNGPVTGLRWDYAITDGNALTTTYRGSYELQGLQNEFYINGAKDEKISKAEPVDFTAGNRLVLFASYSTSRPDNPTGFANLAKIRLYSFAIAEGNELKMNLLPCRYLMDGTVGLYDAVGKRFYSSDSGVALSASDDAEGSLVVVGKSGEVGSPTLPYGVSRGIKVGDVFACSVSKRAETANGMQSCLGYQLETNNLNGAWVPWKSGKENSFIYEHPENTNVRLTWKWGTPGFLIFVY